MGSREAQDPGQGLPLPKSKAGAAEEWKLPGGLGKEMNSLEAVGRAEQGTGTSSPASGRDAG